MYIYICNMYIHTHIYMYVYRLTFNAFIRVQITILAFVCGFSFKLAMSSPSF